MAQRFSPSKPLTGSGRRLARFESGFRFERGPITSAKRDNRHIEDHRKRATNQRAHNTFKPSSQRSMLTIGEKDIGKYSPRVGESQARNHGLHVQTLPSVDKEERLHKLMPRCFEYVQNYHHYILDIKKLDRGERVPYLSSSPAKNDTGSATEGCEREIKPKRHGWASSRPRHYSGLPSRPPRSSKNSRQSSAVRARNSSDSRVENELVYPSDGSTVKSTDLFDSQFENGLVDPREGSAIKSRNSCDLLCENEFVDSMHNSDVKSRNIFGNADEQMKEYEFTDSREDHKLEHQDTHTSLQNAIVTEIETELGVQINPSVISGQLPRLDLRLPDETRSEPRRSGCNSKPELKPPFVTPEDSPRTFRHSRNASRATSAGIRSECDFYGVATEIYKPHLEAFTTRIPPLKAPALITHSGRKHHTTPDYQRYRILCDAFRPSSAHETGRRQAKGGARRPNFVTATELDYYIDVVTSINNFS
ncbi:uncharacterized protein LOC116608640 [Nematostella vectensis]|uniref:uncharacterized protein LOC116608640 n=1 Tax=Nematostella vectensis TaxID=45351 RepID=UPI00207736F3|nr:uncharacterized protein LOC116608640 [Nematostella vectensis]